MWRTNFKLKIIIYALHISNTVKWFLTLMSQKRIWVNLRTTKYQNEMIYRPFLVFSQFYSYVCYKTRFQFQTFMMTVMSYHRDWENLRLRKKSWSILIELTVQLSNLLCTCVSLALYEFCASSFISLSQWYK